VSDGNGYTFTTLSSRPGEPVRVGVLFHLDNRAWISVPGTGSGEPHLCISHGDVQVNICPSPGQVTDEDARIARLLADNAVTYAAELERLCPAGGADGPGTAAA
jgi:hypothetical protein